MQGNKPNITAPGFLMYLDKAIDALTYTIDQYVKAGRISSAEADDYKKIHINRMKEIQAKVTGVDPKNWPVLCLGIRGYYLDSVGGKSVNDRNLYDDAFILVGPGYFNTFRANTDPRLYKVGIALLLPGVHFFKQGIHGASRGAGYEAFRTADPLQILPVLRDGQNGIKEGVTINLHAGGEFSTNSAGCQTVIKSSWPEFKKDAYQLTKDNNKILPYLLTEEIAFRAVK